MHLRPSFSALLLFSLAAGLHARRQASRRADKPILDSDFEAFVNGLLKDFSSSAGAAVGVIRRDSGSGEWNVEKAGYGFASLDGKKVTPDTLFGIASNSKTFAALSLGMIIANETLSPRLQWDSELATVIPGWKLQDPLADSSATIIDALSHRTGLPRHDLIYEPTHTAADIVQRLQHLKSSAKFRDIWQYTNNMYSVLSWIPELVLPNKPTMIEYVQEHVLKPLGMNASTFSASTAEKTGMMAQPIGRQGVDPHVDPLAPGIPRGLPFWFKDEDALSTTMAGVGGLISSVSDLVTFVQSLLLEGRHPVTNATVIPAGVVDKVSSGVTVMIPIAPSPELSPVVYGAGQLRGTYRGHELIEHGGDLPGLSTQITRFPSDNVGIVVLTNDDNWGRLIHDIIKYRISDLIFGLEPIDWTKRILAEVKESIQPETPREPALEGQVPPLAGLYRHESYGTLELCLFPPPSDEESTSETCKTLTAEFPRILPGVLKQGEPALVMKWNKFWAPYGAFHHVKGDNFSISVWNSLPTGDESEPFWAYRQGDPLMMAEFAYDSDEHVLGFAATSFWGAGDGVPSPVGATPQERAEVWFERV